MKAASGHRLVAPRRAALAAFLLLVLPASGAGQEPTIDSPYRWIPKGLRVGLVGGYFDADRGSFDFGPGPTEMLAGRVRARVSSPLAIELGVIYGNSNRRVIDPRLESGPAAVDTLGSPWIAAEFGLQLSLTGARTWNGIQPYLLLGAAIFVGADDEQSELFTDPELEDFRYKLGTAPSFMGGFGAEYRLSERIGVGFELRDFLLRLKAPDAFFLPEVLETIEEAGATAPEDTQWPHNLELSIGLWYYL